MKSGVSFGNGEGAREERDAFRPVKGSEAGGTELHRCPARLLAVCV